MCVANACAYIASESSRFALDFSKYLLDDDKLLQMKSYKCKI